MRLCRAFDRAPRDASEAAYARLMTAVIKYWICKKAPPFIYEAMECLGGNGYVEDSMLPRLYREAPVNAIWEGSGNVMCLDVLRALSREGEVAQGILGTLRSQAGSLPGIADAFDRASGILLSPGSEAHARYAVEALAMIAATAALCEHAPAFICEGFAASQFGPRGSTFGSVAGQVARGVLDRALPA
jgi:putative acyl-CoA dehydrogenase